MRNRIFLAAIYLGALWSVAYAVRLPTLGWVLLAVGAVPAFTRSVHPAIRFSTEVAAAVAALLLFHPLGLLIQATMGIAALSISRAPTPSADRAVLGGLVISVVAAYLRPLAALGFIVLAGLAVLAMVEGGAGDHETVRERTRLALTLALIAAVGSTVAAVIVRLLPWQTGLAALLSAIAYPILRLLALLHVHRHITFHVFQHQTKGAAQRATRAAAAHHATLTTTILVVIGLMILALILYAAYRHFAQNQDLPTDPAFEDGIVRETLTDSGTDWLGRRRHPLAPVRRLVQQRHHQAHRRHNPRQPQETWREWMAREEPNLDREAAVIYEEIRYGDGPDTKEAANRLTRLWPRRR